MVVLRATRKVLRTLPQSANDDDTSDTALGDWYVNRIVVDRKPLLLFVSSTSRLAILAPAREVRKLPERFPALVVARLRRLGADERAIEAELNAMDEVRIARTKDRSITGQMVDFAKAMPFYLPAEGWDDETLLCAEEQLSETPCLSGRSFEKTIFPDRKTNEVLEDAWLGPSKR